MEGQSIAYGIYEEGGKQQHFVDEHKFKGYLTIIIEAIGELKRVLTECIVFFIRLQSCANP